MKDGIIKNIRNQKETKNNEDHQVIIKRKDKSVGIKLKKKKKDILIDSQDLNELFEQENPLPLTTSLTNNKPQKNNLKTIKKEIYTEKYTLNLLNETDEQSIIRFNQQARNSTFFLTDEDNITISSKEDKEKFNVQKEMNALDKQIDQFFQRLHKKYPQLQIYEEQQQQQEQLMPFQFSEVFDESFIDKCKYEDTDDEFYYPLTIPLPPTTPKIGSCTINIDDLNDNEQLYQFFQQVTTQKQDEYHFKTKTPKITYSMTKIKRKLHLCPSKKKRLKKSIRKQERLKELFEFKKENIRKEREFYSKKKLNFVKSLINHKKYKEAFHVLENYLYLDPKNAKLLYKMGVICDELSYFLIGFQYYKRAARLGCPKSMFELAGYYEDGIATPVNIEKAIMYYHRSAIKANPSAMVQLGLMYDTYSNYLEQDLRKSYLLYEAAAMMGHCVGISNLGCYIRDGIGNTSDSIRAIYLFKQAACKHYASGMFNLGAMIERGEGVEASEELALSCYLLAKKMKTTSHRRVHSFNESSNVDFDIYIENVQRKIINCSSLNFI
mmetsp:Transcript_5975/g.8713  ORF Transcript_5975/g.8713 Transcript_5975/m.8713 type:complete len:551 (+) Transcript_5975:122-1774(+)